MVSGATLGIAGFVFSKRRRQVRRRPDMHSQPVFQVEIAKDGCRANHAANRESRWRSIYCGLFSLVVLAGCHPFPETWQWNQKLTIDVVTPAGIASGSAVAHVSWQELNSVGNYPSSYSGEATMVEISPGRYLFALIGEDTKYIALRTFERDLGENAGIAERGFAAMARLRGARDVPRKHYPLLVTFTDIADPKSVARVDPDNLAATFGPSVALKNMTLEITDERVTEGKVEQVLGWLEAVGRQRATLIPNPPRLATDLYDPEIQLLSPAAFSTELFR
ncbi:hypothetical protein RFM99_33705 [Mesorhizobium sp. VK4C]|uniref:hypothetical protein n=1 Tax=Mesorhizobium captivum TaxID=3072319 RepID=UPI002A23F8E7|nr:hypothetical protein [Mesorhizobium sp. VK4C]MDX8503313.1 hypothetical protein [Mesorhizobium sp. VK4C]